MPDARISVVSREDLAEVLPLVRAYLDFYAVDPPDADVRALCEHLIDEPSAGLQLVARDDAGRAVGFATLYWTWSTLSASRIAVMNDLFVAPEARGTGVADALIAACARQSAEHGATVMEWTTALDNHRAQAVYDRVGGKSSRWLSYELPLDRLAP